MPIPSDEDMKRISRTVTYVERLQRSAPVAPSQQQFVAPIVQLIRVTGDAAVSGRYPAVVQDYDADADTWSDLTDADCYAIDPDGGALAAGTYLARRWGEYNSLPVFTPTEQGLNATLLTIAEVDASPSYTSILTLTVDSADGFVLTQPGAGQARLDIAAATASQAGIVSTTTQTIGGEKTFLSDLTKMTAVTGGGTFVDVNPLSGYIRISTLCRFGKDGSDAYTFISHTNGVSSETGSVKVYGDIGAGQGRVVFDHNLNSGGVYPSIGLGYNSGLTRVYGLADTGSVGAIFPTRVVSGITISATSLSDPNADRIAFWDDSAGAVAWLEAGTGLSISGTTISCTATGTVTSITAGTGLSGGTITGSGTIDLANTAVTPGSYTNADITVDAQGRITSASNGSAGSGSPGGSDTHVQFNDGGSFGGEAAFAYDKTTNQLTVPGLTLTEDLLMSAIYDSGSSNLNDYNPTGLSTANTIIYTAGAAINLTGIAGGATDRVLYFFNNSPYTVTVKYVSGSSSSGNQFVTPDAADYALPRLSGMMIRWESSYWLIVAGSGGSSGGSGTVTSITAGTGLSGGTITTSGTIDLADTAVTPGSYTAANITVDAQGRLTSASSGSAGTVPDIVVLQDVKTAGTPGGTATSGAWRTRTLNTETSDAGNLCTLSSNQFTLTAGTYEILAFAPAYYCDDHQAKLYNATDAADVLLGSMEWSQSGGATAPQTLSVISGRFTIGSSKALEIHHRVATTSGTYGFGVGLATWASAIYTQVFLRKVA